MMDSTRITISLKRHERAALMRLAKAELRSPRDQARHILRRELQRLGLLPTDQHDQTLAEQEVGRDLGN